MANEREGAPQPKPDAAVSDPGRAKHDPDAPAEQRSFRPRVQPAPQGAGDPSCGEGLLGPRGDPAEGKR